MANKYYPLATTSDAEFITSLANALADKYGGVEILVQANNNLIFHCPQISDKYIRISFGTGGGYMMAYYGNGVSGASLQDSVQFCDTYVSAVVNSANLVLGDSFLFLDYNKNSRPCVIVIGKTVGGVSICGGFSDSSIASRHLVQSMDNSVKLRFISYNGTVFHSPHMPYKTKLLIACYDAQDGDMLLTLPDGTPDTIQDLYMSFYAGTAPICTITGLFSRRNLYANSDANNPQLATSLLAEFDA